MGRPPKVQKTRDEIVGDLNNTVTTLRTLCEQYERGDYGVAPGIAAAVQTIVYDHGKTKSILNLLGAKGSSRFFATASPTVVDPAGSYLPLVKLGGYGFIPKGGAPTCRAGFAPVYWAFHNAQSLRTAGRLEPTDHTPQWRRVTFGAWWNEKVLHIQGVSISRAELIGSSRNTFGGGHCAGALKRFEEVLARQGIGRFEFSIGGAKTVVQGGLQHPCTRQIAYELQKTLDAELGHLLTRPAEVPPRMSDGRTRVMADVEYLERVLAQHQESAQGETEAAEYVRSQIYWARYVQALSMV